MRILVAADLYDFLKKSGLLFCFFGIYPSINISSAATYEYDAMDRLIISDSLGNIKQIYIYDGIGNRLSKQVVTSNASNSPPSGITPTIASGATNVSTSVKLGWSVATDPDTGDLISYFVYLGTEPNPPLIFSGTELGFTPTNLDLGTTYYWKVVARDTHNAETVSGPWTFRTVDNTPPNAAIEATIKEGIPPFKTLLKSSSASTDDEIVKYEWDVLDDNTIESFAPQFNYTVKTEGELLVRLTVTDTHGAKSSAMTKLYGRPDRDKDGFYDSVDNCPSNPNPTQFDLDKDGSGDVCDDDRDGDGVTNNRDPSPDDARYKSDSDQDGIADEWELEYFGNLSTVNATSDFDGDGSSDRDEALYDSNPKYKPPFIPNKTLNTHWEHSLLVKPDGTLLAWGDNTSAQLGTGSTNEEIYPVTVQTASGIPLSDVVAASTGQTHSLALLKNSSLVAWGRNYFGQLADGTTETRPTPVAVKDNNGIPITGIVAITSGSDFNLALKNDGTIISWGANSNGQLGHGKSSNAEATAPVVMVDGTPLTGIIGIAAGYSTSFALRSDGTVFAWGYYDSYGQSGNNSSGYPERIKQEHGSPITKIRQVYVSGNSHAFALTDTNQLLGWGGNDYGQLGIGSLDRDAHPAAIAVLNQQNTSLQNIHSASAGGYHTLALTIDGKLLSWGWNYNGQLGNGTREDKYTPSPVDYPEKILEAAAGAKHSLILTESGKLLSWGMNNNHQLGNGAGLFQVTPSAVLDKNGNAIIVP